MLTLLSTIEKFRMKKFCSFLRLRLGVISFPGRDNETREDVHPKEQATP